METLCHLRTVAVCLGLSLLVWGGCSSDPATSNQPTPEKDTATEDDSAPAPDLVDPQDTGKDMAEPEDLVTEDLPPKQCGYDWECEDNNVCTQDKCGPEGLCQHPSASGPCDDGETCTQNDSCVEGVCVGSAQQCDDGNGCTVDGCKKGECTHKASTQPQCALEVVFQSPAMGAHIVGSGAVQLKGKVTSPAAPVASLLVAGFNVTPDADGSFSAALFPKVGVNIAEAVVKDGLGRSAKAQRSFLVAGTFHPPGTYSEPTLLTVGDGAAQAWLRQDVLDDENNSDMDDLAALAWLILQNLDLNTMIPHPLLAEGSGAGVAWCEWTVDVTNIQYQVGDVDLTAVDGGMMLYTSLTNLSADISAVADWCPDAIGTVYASEISVEASILGSSSGGCKVSLSLASSNVEIWGLEVDLTGGFASLFDWLVNWFSEELTAKIEEQVETWFANAFVEKVSGMLEDFTNYYKSFELPAVPGNPPGNPVTLRICASELNFTPDGGAVGVHAGVGTDSAIDHPSAGSVARSNCSIYPGSGATTAAPLPHLDQIEAAIAEDVLNQVLFSAWWGGHLNVALSADLFGADLSGFGITGGNVDTDPYLPPVLTSCTDDGAMELQIGDLALDVDLQGDTLSGTMKMVASARVAAVPTLTPDAVTGRNTIGLKLLGVRQLAVQVLEAQGNLQGSEGLVESLVSAVVVDLFAGQTLSDALGAYPIPVLDLGEYVSVVPSGTELTFNPLTAEFAEGYLLLGGELVAP